MPDFAINSRDSFGRITGTAAQFGGDTIELWADHDWSNWLGSKPARVIVNGADDTRVVVVVDEDGRVKLEG